MTQDQLSGLLIDWIFNNPVWLTTGALVIVAVGFTLVAMLFFTRIVTRKFRDEHSDIFSFTVTNIAVLYAVLLAFIAVATWENFSHAGELVGTEANLVGNLYRDTDGFSNDTTAFAMRADLRQYVSLVVTKEWPAQRAGRVSVVAWPALESFQRKVLTVEPQGRGEAVVMQEVLRSLNQLYSARRSRLNASQEHIPGVVWWVLFLVGNITVGFTFLLGARSVWANAIASIGIAVALVLVVALIVQLDYPFRGTVSVSADAFGSLLANMDRLHPSG
jgi:hypothetical protein